MDEPARIEDSAQGGRQEGEGQTGHVVTMKRFSDYSKEIMKFIGAIVVAYYPVRRDITVNAIPSYFLVCRILICSTFLADFLLFMLTKFGRMSERLYITSKFLIHTTGVLMMLTSISLLLLLNPSYAVVTILVLPVMAIVIIYNGNNTGQALEFTDYYEDHQSELKQFFDLSASVTLAAFGGMIGTIFGYFKNFPKDVDPQGDVKFSEAFIFFTLISGLLAMLLTAVPPSLHCPNARSRFMSFIKVLSGSLFVLLALTVLAVAAEFLEEFILLAFFPILLAVMVWFGKEFILQEDGTSQADGATGHHESEPDTSPITIIIFIFADLMAVYSAYFGSEDNDLHLKTCMFFMSLAFMSSMCWMLLAFRPPGTQALAMAVKILKYSTFASSVIAMLDLIFIAIRSGN